MSTDYISREKIIRLLYKFVYDLDEQINDSVNYPHLRSDYKVCKTQVLDCIYAIANMPADVIRVFPCKDVEEVVHCKRRSDNGTQK